MSYKINKTDGTLLVDLVDGKVDQDTTDLTLVGKSYSGYGEFWNENFVNLLENFANVAPPPNPIIGQLWYDTSESRLTVWNGVEFKSTQSTVVSGSQPILLSGDVWIDNANKQVKFFDGTDLILSGPIYTADQGKSGWEVITVKDQFDVSKVCTRIMVSNSVVALVSKETFTALNTTENISLLDGFGLNIKAGVNISSNFPDWTFLGAADSTLKLTEGGIDFVPSDFLQITANNTATGTLHVKNDLGVLIGDDSDHIIKVEGTSVVARNQLSGSDYKIQVTQGIVNVDALTIKSTDGFVGVWQAAPQYPFDINGNTRIQGDLLVEGSSTSLDVQNLRVEDKLIELAITSDSTLLTDAEVDGSGLTIRSSSGNEKYLIWQYADNSWNSSSNFNVPAGFAYKINGVDILTDTAIASSVTSAPGLTAVGDIVSLTVTGTNPGVDLNITNETITTTAGGLEISSNGDINVSSGSKITGVGTATGGDPSSTVVNKQYLAEQLTTLDLALSLDITGLSNAQIALVLEDISPAADKELGVIALIHCVEYSGTTTYDADDGLSKTTVSVDANGVLNQTVLEDIAFASASGTLNLTVTRSRKRFQVIDNLGTNEWSFDTDLASSV